MHPTALKLNLGRAPENLLPTCLEQTKMSLCLATLSLKALDDAVEQMLSQSKSPDPQ
jgi:hypothetical protein